MGKTSKKMAKKQQGNKIVDQQKKILELKKKIEEYKKVGKYEEALSIVIDVLQMKCYDTDVIFDAAELYFMAGDYERAMVWINKTMEFEPGHLGARILLTRICMLGDRADSGLGILEVVLKTGHQQLTSAQKNQVEEMLEYYRYTSNEDELKKMYPHVAEFLGLTPPSDVEKIVDVVTEPIEEFIENVTESQKTDNEAVKSVEVVKNEIMMKSISLQEKITLCNSFAGAYYYENKLMDARNMLQAALLMDEYNGETLRNMVVLSLACKDKDSAIQYAAKLPQTDFALLKLIKDYV